MAEAVIRTTDDGSLRIPAGSIQSSTDPVDPVRRDRLIIALAYVLSWGAILVNRGLYWDDWTAVGRSSAAIVDGAREFGLPWVGYLYAGLFATPLPGLLGHILVFFAYLLSALLLHAVLRHVPGLTRIDALVAALIFAIFPVNYARIALVDLMYGLSLLAFLAATWLLIRHLETGRLWRRVAALGLYVVSFTTASLLVLYVVPVVIGAAIVWKSAKAPRWSLVLRYADFLAAPVAYWLVKSALFKASGIYSGDNAVTLSRLTHVPTALLSIPGQVLFEPLARAGTVAGLAGVVVGLVASVWLLRRSRATDRSEAVPAPVLALIGVVILGLGVFAYLAVGLVPTIWDWSSRHQLLVPIGAGLLVAAAVRGIQGAGRAGPVFGVAVGLLLGICVVADARTLVAYQLDWFKQTALIDAARTIPAVRTARHIRVVDSAAGYNALRRTVRFYEYNSMFSLVLGDTRRLVSDSASDPSGKDLTRFIDHPAYHMGEYVPSPVDLELRVSSSPGSPGTLKVLQLVLLEALGSPSFEAEVSGLINVRATPVGEATPIP